MDAIYVRVSTEEQARSGYSIDGQLSACRSKLLSFGSTDIKEYVDDGYSGEFLERPGLDELRQDLRAGLLQNVVFYDPDRMARVLDIQLLIADEVEKAGANLLFCTHDYDASPEGKLFFSIRGAISQFEKAKIRERTMSGKRTKALKGKLTFNDKAFGYDWDAKNSMYIINPLEAEVIKTIFNSYVQRQIGVRSLSLELKSQGVKNRRSLPFTPTHIHRILTNEMYAGTKWSFKYYEKKIGHKKSKKTKRDPSNWIPISVPAIIEKQLWEKAQRILHTNTIFSKRNTHREYLLRGLIRCGSCGYSMIGSRKVSNKKEYLYYVCPSKSEKRECSNGNIRADKIDILVWDEMVKTITNRHNFSNFRNKGIDNSEAIFKLNNYLNDLAKKKTAILKWVTDNIITIEDAEKKLKEISKEISATQVAVNGLQIKEKPIIDIDPEEVLSADTFEKRRNIMLKLNLPVTARRTGWNPEDIDWWF